MSVIAEVFEFVIGGMLLLAATVFLIVGIAPGESWTGDLVGYLQDSDQTLLVVSVGIGLSYAAGILGEGGSHAIFEWRLNRVTWAHEPFRREVIQRIATHNAATAEGGKRLTALPDDYTPARLPALKDERERQRTYVMSRHPLIHREVESQLKRLRVERMAAVSGLIFIVAFAVRGDWPSVGIAAVLTVYLVWLVLRRFRRFCGSISAGYAHGRAEEAMPAATHTDGETA